jgi:hypothetical protein
MFALHYNKFFPHTRAQNPKKLQNNAQSEKLYKNGENRRDKKIFNLGTFKYRLAGQVNIARVSLVPILAVIITVLSSQVAYTDMFRRSRYCLLVCYYD